jgi:hypothetical protein
VSDLPRTPDKHWIEYAMTAAVLVISLISLGVAIGTEDANRRMVAAASWPILQIDTGNTDDQLRPSISISIGNSGVGPAKVESLEVFWKGKAYSNSADLVRDCCGLQDLGFSKKQGQPRPTPLIKGAVAGTVIRAGETRLMLHLPLGPDNAAGWNALDRTRFELRYRICYCSVFDECWVSNLGDLHPTPVDRCPVPKIPFTE